MRKGAAKFKQDNLFINLNKSKILYDQKDVNQLKELEGIQIVEKLKYLGCTLSLNRTTLIKDAKDQCNKFM